MVGGGAAFYWLISTHKLERPSDWLISLHKRACGVEVGREQGGGRLLKFLGEADESTEISLGRACTHAKPRDLCTSLDYFTHIQSFVSKASKATSGI